MNQIIRYIKQYARETDKKVFIFVTIFTAVIIFINYNAGLDRLIRKNNPFPVKLFWWYIVFLTAFAVPYMAAGHFGLSGYKGKRIFLLLVLFAPFIFALKITLDITFPLSYHPEWNDYWNHIVYWPFLLLVVWGILFFIWKKIDRHQPFYGIQVRHLDLKPYLLMLLIMVPLIAIASTQPDFLAVYPKLNTISAFTNLPGFQWWHQLLYEISYGIDFIGIELFFRGFLILAFVKWAGRDAILPMACFYCAIHFGKPMGECISSYFGGILLGIVVYHTRSIFGGLLVHLGIAWMMELGGYIGNSI